MLTFFLFSSSVALAARLRIRTAHCHRAKKRQLIHLQLPGKEITQKEGITKTTIPQTPPKIQNKNSNSSARAFKIPENTERWKAKKEQDPNLIVRTPPKRMGSGIRYQPTTPPRPKATIQFKQQAAYETIGELFGKSSYEGKPSEDNPE